MTHEIIYPENENKKFYIESYVANKIDGFTRDAILIIPGGGYTEVCAEREGEPIALEFLPRGYNAFVLHYSVGDEIFPRQLSEASKALIYIKENSEKFNINPERVFVIGFSAGGHLAAALGTMPNATNEMCEEEKIDCSIAGIMLIYPVITPKYTKGVFCNMLNNKNPTFEDLSICDILNYVSKKSSPAFIVHTSNDEIVDVRNSLALANAYAKNNIQFELHIFPDAPHGIALGNEITKCGVDKWCNKRIAKWMENAVSWARSIKK